MTRETQIPAPPLIHHCLAHAALASRPGEPAEPMSGQAIQEIERRLGGSSLLKSLGASAFAADHDHVAFTLGHVNPGGVRTVVITAEPQGTFQMTCYGVRQTGSLSAPRLASAGQIVAENLATVLGQLAGIETIHHRHF